MIDGSRASQAPRTVVLGDYLTLSGTVIVPEVTPVQMCLWRRFLRSAFLGALAKNVSPWS